MNDIFFDKVVLRIPSYSLNYYRELVGQDTNNCLKNLIQDQFFLNSLFFASSEVYNLAVSYHNLDEEKRDKLNKTIFKYAIRSSTRCTPFGLFASNSTFKSAISNNEITILSNKRWSNIRLDMNYSLRLANSLINDEKIRFNLKYFPNDTLYKIKGEYRYTEYSFTESKLKKYTLSSIQVNSIVAHILKKAVSGISFPEILRCIIEQTSVSNEEAYEFAIEIIESQILLSDLEVSSFGVDPEKQIFLNLNSLKNHENNKNLIETTKFLNQIESHLKKCRSSIFEKDFVSNSDQLRKDLSNFINFENKSLLQCDLYLPESIGGFSANQFKLIKKSISVYKKFNHLAFPKETRLEKFKKEFLNRYDQKIVPLCEVVDPDYGIGYGENIDSVPIEGNPLIEGLLLNSNVGSQMFELDSLDYFIIEKIKNSNEEVINIQEKEIEKFNNKQFIPNRLSTESILFSLLKEKKSGQDFIYINNIIEGSANKIIGRFTSGNDDIFSLSKQIVKFEKEQNKNAIYAEIDHFPETHLGNIIFRSYTYDHVIGFLGKNGIDKIYLSDIYLSIEKNLVILRSKSLGKELIPVYSNVLNSSLDSHLPLFQLLLDISSQYRELYNPINWNKYHQFYSFIPRIQSSNLILKKATWILKYDEFKNRTLSEVRNLLLHKKVYKKFVICNGDNEILIDSTHDLSLRIFIDELKKYKNLIISEFIFEDFNSIVKDEYKNDYNHEFIISAKKNTSSNLDLIKQKPINIIKKSLFLDDDWIFFKIYISENKANYLLRSLLPILEKLVKNKKVHLHFFIKYYDPKFHIRLRVKAYAGISLEITNTLLKKIRLNPFVRNISINEYDRELERYGYDQIPIFEDIFYFDSILAVKSYSHFKDDIWKHALSITNMYCDSFGLNFKEKIDLLESVRTSFEIELNANSSTSKFINERFSLYKSEIAYYISTEYIFLQKNKSLISQLKNEIKKIKYSSISERNFFLKSIIHMSIIRLVKSHNRINEFLIISILIKGLKAEHYKKRIKVD